MLANVSVQARDGKELWNPASGWAWLAPLPRAIVLVVREGE
jgi:hypothetical protein